MLVHKFGGSSLATAAQDYSDTLELIKRDDIELVIKHITWATGADKLPLIVIKCCYSNYQKVSS